MKCQKVSFRPDPTRFVALRNSPAHRDLKDQQRIVRMFSYYSHWLSRFSDMFHRLVINKSFPLLINLFSTFQSLKAELIHALLFSVDRDTPLFVETDASFIAISVALMYDPKLNSKE